MTSTSEFSDAIARPDSRTMAVYLSVLLAMFMAALDMNIVVTALPTIAGDLGDVSLFGWVGAAYLLTTAAVSPFYGKLGDMYGRKITLIVAVALFLAGSLACGAAWSMQTLIGARDNRAPSMSEAWFSASEKIVHSSACRMPPACAMTLTTARLAM